MSNKNWQRAGGSGLISTRQNRGTEPVWPSRNTVLLLTNWRRIRVNAQVNCILNFAPH